MENVLLLVKNSTFFYICSIISLVFMISSNSYLQKKGDGYANLVLLSLLFALFTAFSFVLNYDSNTAIIAILVFLIFIFINFSNIACYKNKINKKLLIIYYIFMITAMFFMSL